ncbi:hypothetical protein FLL45_08665 [Aliikangiella marina]|uniref:Uncharacterized protein n=1 Tax=Aliikangiella marina TaxID=1712262 RepID=A0A545TCQ8_9GAMM|nr:hypothetical protein [Aliikangiella marina]TQV75004.1 hypothetical protein FLL45_08665 [Aliikangiella marina]
MQIVNNYLNSLESYLSEDIRKEVRDELEASILEQVEDKQESLGRELNTEDIEAILLGFGHPMKVAAAYSSNQELVSSSYFPVFKKSLELTLAIVMIATLLLNIPLIFSDANFIKIGIVLLADFIENGVWTFAWVTLLFWVLQTNNISIEGLYKWSPKELSAVNPKLKISRLETLFEITVYLIFLGWWNGAFGWTMTHVFENLDKVVNLSDEWQLVHWSVNIIVGLSIIVDSIKYIAAGWNKATLSANMALNIASLAVIAQIFGFETYVTVIENPDGTIPLEVTLEHARTLINGVLGVLAAIIAWDIFSNYQKIVS